MKRILALLLFAFAAPLVAQQAPIDFTVILHGPDGKPIMNGDQKDPQPVTLGNEAAVALYVALPSDAGESQAHEIARSKLAEKLIQCKACIISQTESALILDRAHQMPQAITALVFGQMAKILDPVAWGKADL